MLTYKYKAIAHFYCTMGGTFNCSWGRLPGGDNVLVLGCPGIWCSVALARWKKFKKEMAWM